MDSLESVEQMAKMVLQENKEMKESQDRMVKMEPTAEMVNREQLEHLD